MTHATECFVGIDISKGSLDIAVPPTNEDWKVVHNEEGVRTLVERLERGFKPNWRPRAGWKRAW